MAKRTTEEQVVSARPRRPRPFWPWLLLLLLLVLGALGALWWFASRDDTVEAKTVPNVVGLQLDEADRRLRSAGFEVERNEVASPKQVGVVLAQRPSPGTNYGEGGIVVISVAGGRRLVDVPDVVGLTAGEATARLEQAGFRTRVNELSGSEPAGTVIAQKPGGGSRAPLGQIVQIKLSKGEMETTTTVVTTTRGPSQGTVPDTVGMDEQAATLTLEDSDFRVRVQDRTVEAAHQDGIVVQQIPTGGTRRIGTTVTIVVGRLR